MLDLSGWTCGVLSNALWGNGSRGDSRKNALWGSKEDKSAPDPGRARAAEAWSWVVRSASWAAEAASR